MLKRAVQIGLGRGGGTALEPGLLVGSGMKSYCLARSNFSFILSQKSGTCAVQDR